MISKLGSVCKYMYILYSSFDCDINKLGVFNNYLGEFVRILPTVPSINGTKCHFCMMINGRCLISLPYRKIHTLLLQRCFCSRTMYMLLIVIVGIRIHGKRSFFWTGPWGNTMCDHLFCHCSKDYSRKLLGESSYAYIPCRHAVLLLFDNIPAINQWFHTYGVYGIR